VANVTHVSVTNVYNQAVVNARVDTGHASFNGGAGGIQARATADEEAAARAPHYAATNEQMRHDSAARAMPALRASANHGQPPVAATAKPGVLSGRGISVAQGRQPNVAQESAVREYGARAPAPREASPRAAPPARPAPPEREGGQGQRHEGHRD
jgi:hypothetical protein